MFYYYYYYTTTTTKSIDLEIKPHVNPSLATFCHLKVWKALISFSLIIWKTYLLICIFQEFNWTFPKCYGMPKEWNWRKNVWWTFLQEKQKTSSSHFKREIQFSFITKQMKFTISTKKLPKNEASKVIKNS